MKATIEDSHKAVKRSEKLVDLVQANARETRELIREIRAKVRTEYSKVIDRSPSK